MFDPDANTAIVTAAALVIGDEILSGRTKDRNIGLIAEHLTAIGIRLQEVRVVGDEEAVIVAAVNALRARFDYVFTTGGIGPTHDDITADAIARALGVEIALDECALALLRAYYEERGLELNAARLRMARVPVGARLVRNPISAAPGFMIANVIVMAGVPAVMQAMLADVTPHLKTGAPVRSVSLELACAEGEIAELFAAHQRAFPDVAMGSYPVFEAGTLRTQLVLRCSDVERLAAAADGLTDQLAGRFSSAQLKYLPS